MTTEIVETEMTTETVEIKVDVMITAEGIATRDTEILIEDSGKIAVERQPLPDPSPRIRLPILILPLHLQRPVTVSGGD